MLAFRIPLESGGLIQGSANAKSPIFRDADYLMNFINNDVIQKSITYELDLFGLGPTL